jgi:cytoskeleton-associated protein 5
LREVDVATATTQTKFTELIMKCLWKLAKSVQDNLKSGTLLPNQLLRDLNNFFIATPPAEWKRRAAEKVALGEMPLRTVKTLLLELVTGLGEGVYEHLDLIDNPQGSYVYPYLHHMLEATKKKDKQASNQSGIQSGNQQSGNQSGIQPGNQSGNQSGFQFGNQSGIQFGIQPGFQSGISSIRAIQDITDNNNISSRPSSISSARSISSVGSDLAFSVTDSARASPSEPISPATPMTPKFPTPISSARSSGSYEVEMNERLTQIFNKIGKREETKKVGIIANQIIGKLDCCLLYY